METTQPASRMHPLLFVAAVSVIALCLAGVGVLAGWLPGPGNRASEPAQSAAPVPDTNPSGATQEQPAAKPASVAQATKKAAKPAKAAVSPAPTSAASRAAPAKCVDCGVVEAINEVTTVPDGTGAGGVAGGVVGGLLGNQIGKGNGRTAATILGVVGGAVAGNQIEKTMKKKLSYEVVVRFDDGTTRTFPSDTPPAWREGDRVRLQNGVLTVR